MIYITFEWWNIAFETCHQIYQAFILMMHVSTMCIHQWNLSKGSLYLEVWQYVCCAYMVVYGSMGIILLVLQHMSVSFNRNNDSSLEKNHSSLEKTHRNLNFSYRLLNASHICCWCFFFYDFTYRHVTENLY